MTLINLSKKIRIFVSCFMKAMNKFNYHINCACNVFCNAYDLLDEIQYPLTQAWKNISTFKDRLYNNGRKRIGKTKY